MSPAAIYEKSHASVVVIVVLDQNSKPFAQGSGFIVRRDRVVTNHHVIKDAARVLVVFADGTSQEAEGIAADSAVRDLAILVVKTGSLSPLKLGNELEVKQGDPVYALGAPRGLELSITNGIVSGFRDSDGQFLLQTTATIAPGSSGGPLFDSSGRVIGVTTSGLSDSPGIYFSVGAGDISRMLRTPGIILPLTTKASPEREQVPTVRGLFVTSNPEGADIFINGIKQPGQTPTTLPLGPGQYDLVLRLSGYLGYSNHVQVKDNVQTKLDAQLQQKPQSNVAWAEVHSTPEGAEIYIDGAPVGDITPARVQIPSGIHIIALKLKGYQIARHGVEASEGGTVVVNETLQPK